MIPYTKLRDKRGYQVALFPLPGFHISQTDYGTASHGGGAVYWATDYLAWGANGRIHRCPCYAPVDIKLVWTNATECVAVWESTQKVHLANGMIDYLTITCYHDNDIENGTYPYRIGQVVQQGQIFFKTGTGGHVIGSDPDHIHLETGYGKYLTSSSSASGTAEYKYHITDYTTPKRLHNYDALFINGTDPYQSPEEYVWLTFRDSGGATVFKNRYPWVLYANKLRNRQVK